MSCFGGAERRLSLGVAGSLRCQVLEGVSGALRVLTQIKCPCSCRGLTRGRVLKLNTKRQLIGRIEFELIDRIA